MLHFPTPYMSDLARLRTTTRLYLCTAHAVPLQTGQETDIPSGTLSFSPLYPCPYTVPLTLGEQSAV